MCATEWATANRFLTTLGMPSLPELHPSQVLHQPPVVNWLLILSYGILIWHRQFRMLLVHLLLHAGSGSGGEGETTTQPPPSAGLAGQVNCSTLQCQEGFSCSAVHGKYFTLPPCVWKLGTVSSWRFIGHQCYCHPFSSCWLHCLHSSACQYMHTMESYVSLLQCRPMD